MTKRIAIATAALLLSAFARPRATTSPAPLRSGLGQREQDQRTDCATAKGPDACGSTVAPGFVRLRFDAGNSGYPATQATQQPSYLMASSFAVIVVDWLATTLTPRDQAA